MGKFTLITQEAKHVKTSFLSLSKAKKNHTKAKLSLESFLKQARSFKRSIYIFLLVTSFL